MKNSVWPWLLLVGSLGCTGTLLASPYPCNGPGPGRQFVGLMQLGGAQSPSTPMCVNVDEGPERTTPGEDGENSTSVPSFADGFHAIAFHPNFDAYWLSGLEAGNVRRATSRALKACQEATGDSRRNGRGGCRAEGSFGFGYVAIVRGSDGTLFEKPGFTPSQALHRALGKCAANASQVLVCETVREIDLSARARAEPDRNPAASESRRTFLAIARSTQADTDRWAYVASGQGAAEKAAEHASAACHAEQSGDAKCELAATGGNVAAAFFIRRESENRSVHRVLTETNVSRLAQAVAALCPSAHDCEVQAVIESRTVGVFTHDFSTSQRVGTNAR